MTPFPNMGLAQPEQDEDPNPSRAKGNCVGIGSGVMVATTDGPQPVEWLRAGDLLMTRDHGYQPLRRVWKTEIPDDQRLQIIHAGSLSHDMPSMNLAVGPDHGLLMSGAEIEIHFGEEEALAPAACLGTPDTRENDRRSVWPAPNTSLYQLLLDDHEIILAEGVWIESFRIDDANFADHDEETRGALEVLLGDRIGAMEAARLCLTRDEARLFKPMETTTKSQRIA
ncbi:Hint domain-containing protein [Celeribacter arenosi]|uniref:Hint domain-containing protein n=1 Tax=Celeribacter arenosi TaxID=792649 RepID=A0ABP7K7N2_9RHOB